MSGRVFVEGTKVMLASALRRYGSMQCTDEAAGREITNVKGLKVDFCLRMKIK